MSARSTRCQSADSSPQDVAPATAHVELDLRIAVEWTSVLVDNMTLGRIIEACIDQDEVPEQVHDAVKNLLRLSPSELSLHEVTPLAECIADLVSMASDPELLASREFSRSRTALRTLGKERGLSREAVRKRLDKDAIVIRGLLESDRFRAVRWAMGRLQADLGAAVPADSHIVDHWRERLGGHAFEALRWLAQYVYDTDWLVRGSGGTRLADFSSQVDEAIGDAWLVRPEDLFAEQLTCIHLASGIQLLAESGRWRDIGDGWLVRWDGPLQDKAARVLELVGRPMTPAELIEAIGYGSERTLKQQRDSLIRIDKQFRLALPEWDYEEYKSITVEINQRIERGGGVASVSEIVTEFVRDFGVKKGSVHAYLENGPYVISGDEVRHLINRGYTPSSVDSLPHAVRVDDNWGQRFTVSDSNLRGYSFNLDRDIAAHNGLHPEDSLTVPAMHADTVVGEASLIWRLNNLSGTVDVGRLSTVLNALGLTPGASIVIVATREACSILRADELPKKPKEPLSADAKRAILGRR